MWSCPCSSASSEDGGSEKPLGDLVGKVIKKLGPDGRISEEEMADAWEDVIGKAASTHARPVSLAKGTLTVNVDASSWLYELTLKKRDIMKKLAGRLKGKSLKDIRFRIGEL